MAGERMHPILPCPDLDEAIAFYEALGFRPTYRQMRPNPYAVMALEDMAVHLAGIDGFDPASSVSSVIIVLPDPGASYDEMARGLRGHYGRLPSRGIPRVLPSRRKQGTTTGFSIVDVGGNWLRFYGAAADEEEDGEEAATGLGRVVEVAARQGDSRGADDQALAILDRGLARHRDAPAVDRVRALLYRAELLGRTGQDERAAAALVEAEEVELTAAEATLLARDLAHVRETLAPGPGGTG